MAEGTEDRERTWGWWLALLALAVLVLAYFLVPGHGHNHPRAAGSPAAAPAPAPPPGQTGGGGSAGTRPNSRGSHRGGQATHRVSTPPRNTSTSTTRSSRAAPRAPVTAPVVCQTDLPLSRSPNAPYNFMCTQAGHPLTWPSANINLYVGRLSAVQRLALPAALNQWEAVGHFTVTQVATPAAANVTMTAAPLSNQEAGYAQVHYSCTNGACFYDQATVELSSTQTLAHAAWVSTICHELGHAAGLNHVSRHPEVMYPYVNETSPDAYTPGDIKGLQAEYQQRSNVSMGNRSGAVSGAWVGLG